MDYSSSRLRSGSLDEQATAADTFAHAPANNQHLASEAGQPNGGGRDRHATVSDEQEHEQENGDMDKPMGGSAAATGRLEENDSIQPAPDTRAVDSRLSVGAHPTARPTRSQDNDITEQDANSWNNSSNKNTAAKLLQTL